MRICFTFLKIKNIEHWQVFGKKLILWYYFGLEMQMDAGEKNDKEMV